MRIQYDANGYVILILYGCTSAASVEYTGLVPNQPIAYADMEDWAERAKIQAYKLDTQGNLVFDAEKAAALTADDYCTPLDVSQGGTGANNATDAQRNLGIPTRREIFDMIYPIGAIYISASPTSPETLFGGNWQRIEDKFLLASGIAEAGSTGGAATHKHLAPIGQRGNNSAVAVTDKFGRLSNQTISGAKAAIGAVRDTSSYSDVEIPYTQEGNSLPPFLAVYVWQRLDDDTPTDYAMFVDADGNEFLDAHDKNLYVKEV